LVKWVPSGPVPGAATWDNLLLVDKGGNDATALRNSLTQKFLTIQAALDAAQAGDVVWVGPGTFAEDLTWPEIDNVTLVGYGVATLITPAWTGITIVAATTEIQGATIENLAIIAPGECITCQCPLFPASFDTRLNLRNLFLQAFGEDAAVNCYAMNFVEMQDVVMEGAAMYQNVARVRAQDCTASYWVTEYEGVQPTPTQGRLEHFIANCAMRFNVVVGGQAQVFFDRDCRTGNVIGSLSEQGGNFGVAKFQGSVTGNVQIGFNFTEAIEHPAVNFDYAQVMGELDVSSTGGTERCQARARQAVFYTVEDQVIRAGTFTDLDLQGSLFRQDSLVVSVEGDGRIDRSVWKQFVPSLTAMPHTLIFADSSGNPIPYPDLAWMGFLMLYPYSVVFESYAPTDYPIHPMTKPVGGSTMTYDSATNPSDGLQEVTIIRTHDPEVYNPGLGD